MPYLPEGVCARCSARRGARGTCRGCRQLSPALSAVRAPMAYEGAARAAIVTLKFRSGRYLAPLMGEFLCAHLAMQPVEADVIVPVPLTRGRLRERGFNQAAVLADQVAGALGVHVAKDALRRAERPSQRTLSAAERIENLRGAFSLDKSSAINGRRVLIVDDVVTTGATVSACADTLAQAGASRIVALAFARDL
jgi:ComF family protein